MRKPRTIAVAAGVSLALLLAACGSDDDDGMGGMDMGGDSTEQTTEATDAAADFNDADVMFAQGMIPHHEQAVEMAGLAADRSESPEVQDLAARIEGAQGPEIEQMQGLLADWGEEEMGDMGGMDMEGMEGMEGMASADEMAELEAASGTEFDQLFLTLMIEHHEGAVAMAEAEVADGQNAEAQDLAQAIIDAQQSEIDEMQGLLDAL